METLKWLLFLVKPYWFYFLIISLVSFGGFFCSIGMTEGLRRLVNAGQQKNVPMVWASVCFTVIVIFIWFVINFISTYLRVYINHRSIYKLQSDLFACCLNLKQSSLDSIHSGDLITRLDNAAYVVKDGFF